jgi:hypothetical protein
MQNEKLKKILKLSAIVSFAAASISIAETSFTSALEMERMNSLAAHYSHSPINTLYNYSNFKIFNTLNYISPDDDNLKKIMQMEPQMQLPTGLDNSAIPLVLNAESLDYFLDSIANFKKSPEETAFDNALSKVLEHKKDTSIVDSYLLKATAWQESRLYTYVVSDKGAVSLMQLMKETYLTFRPHDKFPDDAFIPVNNISAGRDYYLYLVDYIKNNHPRADTLSHKDIVDLAIISYNSGPGAFTHTYVKEDNKIVSKLKPANQQWLPEFMPPESRNHLIIVSEKLEEFKARDKRIEFAQEYKKRKEYISANNAFYGRSQI